MTHYVPKSQVVPSIACMRISLPYLSNSEILLREQLQIRRAFRPDASEPGPRFPPDGQRGKIPHVARYFIALSIENCHVAQAYAGDDMQTAPTQQAIRVARLVSSPTLPAGSRVRLVGLACIVCTALGWGLNWPATKFLLTTCPPLSARGVSGLVAGAALFAVAACIGETLIVPRPLWGRLVVAALLNVSAWMGLTTASLLWLPAGQAATLAYTMPVWAALLAWPMLSERPVPRQIGAIVLGIFGVVILVGGANVELDAARFPGVAIALSAAVLFALARFSQSACLSRCRGSR